MPDADPDLISVFSEALELSDPAVRAAYLDRACEGKAELRQRVEALLNAHGGAGRFLEPDSFDMSDTNAPETKAEPSASVPMRHPPAQPMTGEHGPGAAIATVAGQVIAGRYTLVEVLGEGGMGTVYRADQTEPVKRPVALKLIKVGMDSRAVLARFDAERQALALMDHPNIARVYDGGTTAAGQPFFVMELVSGAPITDYCDRKRLSVRTRLELFVSVCQAVQHAHQKGIIHRDLKPSNVLVTEVDGRPTPKVIDFGVAKAMEVKLTDQSFADSGAIVGTPAYMSPEQADPSSMDIDTRTDVYALGVILYELLAGSPPIDPKQFQRGAFLEMLRIVREVDPPKPSTKVRTSEALPSIAASRDVDPEQLKRALRGDLDWIVMKALEKDRTRRYETANGFAADVLRHLAYEPVQAAPPNRGYRLRKFVRKHRRAVIAASLIVGALLAGIAGTTWGLFQADQRRAEAEKARAAEAERVKERDAAVKSADGRAEELKYQLGVSDMVLAAAAYDNRDFALAAERLCNVPAGQRGWEWHYLKRLTRGGLFTLYGHTGEVRRASFSPDGSRIVTAGGAWNPNIRGEVKVWDARTGTHLLDLKGHRGSIGSVAFSPDGARIVAAGGTSSDRGELRVFDARTGMPVLDLSARTSWIGSASFSPDGTRIVTAGGVSGMVGEVNVWDAQTGKRLLELKGHTAQVSSASFSPEGTRIVTCGLDKTAKVWDARSGLTLHELEWRNGWLESASFSPDGTRIVTGGFGEPVKVWDARTGTVLLVLKSPNGVKSVSFSPDGTRILASLWYGRTATVWDAVSGAHLLDMKGHTKGVYEASFSPDGDWIVTASSDNTAKVWDAHSGTPRLQLRGHIQGISSASFSPDGKNLATGSPDGKVRLWDARLGVPVLELTGHINGVTCVAFSPDGTRILTGGGDQAAREWDVRSGRQLLELKGHAGWVWSASFSTDGTRIITAGDAGDKPGEVKVWDARSGAPLLVLSSTFALFLGLSEGQPPW